MPTIDYKKISIKQLDELYEYIKPERLERRLTFLKYSKHLIKEDLISEANVDKYSTIDYIRDFEEFERNYMQNKLREQIDNRIEKYEYWKNFQFIGNISTNIVHLYGAYKLIKILF